MKNRDLQSLVAGLGNNLVSLYQYQQTGDNKIPVFVLKEMDFVNMSELKKYFEGKDFIVLTQDDVQNGQDIFALKFLHIKKHSELFAGKSLLDDLKIDKKYLRHNLETEVRNKLIQLREAYLSFQGGKKFLEYIFPVMEVIWEGVYFVLDMKLTEKLSQIDGLKTMISDIDEKLNFSGKFFLDFYNGNTIKEDEVPVLIKKVNDYLIELRNMIDSL